MPWPVTRQVGDHSPRCAICPIGVSPITRAPSLGKVPHLRARGEFTRVQQQGRRFRGRLMAVMVSPGSPQSRIGLTVSRKVGNAVVRNRVRRRLREIVRTHRELLAPGCDHVVVAFPPLAQADFATLREELTWLLSQASAWASSRSSCSP